MYPAQQSNDFEESKQSAMSMDILAEFAREQQLAEEREDLEEDILRDFE